MPLGDAARDGQADAEAAGLGAAGRVCAVKAVEEPAERGRVEHVALIFRADDDAVPPLRQGKDDGRVGRCVLDGIVEQDGHELPDGVLVTAVGQPRRHAHVERMPGGRRKVAKRLRRLRKRIADLEVRHLQGRGLLIHARERDELIDELREFFGLGLRLVDPLLLPDLHLQHLQARGDDGNGRFELVGSIRDELLLPLGRLNDRRDGPARAEHDDAIHQRHAHGRGGQRHPRKRHDRVQLLIAVEEDCHPAVGVRMDDVVFIPRCVAEARAVAQCGGEILRPHNL